jgi:hypothetical protein
MSEREVEAVARAIWKAFHPLARWDEIWENGGPTPIERDHVRVAAAGSIAALDGERGDGSVSDAECGHSF